MTYVVNDIVADNIVDHASRRIEALTKLVNQRALRGPVHADRRAHIRGMIEQYELVIAGFNTGEGVTRGSA